MSKKQVVTEENKGMSIAEKEPTAEQRVWDELYDDKSIKLELKLGHMDLYTFLMYHSYCGVTGILGILLSVYCLVQGILQISQGETDSMTAVLMLVGVWFIVLNPLSMLGKAATQLKTNPSLQKPITYYFNEKGMLQEQGEVRTGCKWSLITKTVFMKRIWILYAGKIRGTILPVAQLGDHQDELKALVKAHTGKKR